jgi:AbrB family looped-hinge helix DNA binding protein
MATRVSNKGQIILPAELRARDRIEPGQVFEVERLGCGKYRLMRCRPMVGPLARGGCQQLWKITFSLVFHSIGLDYDL